MWQGSLQIPPTPVQWQPVTVRVLDLLHLPLSQHYKTVRMTIYIGVFFDGAFLTDMYFQLRLGGVVTCSELIVSRYSKVQPCFSTLSFHMQVTSTEQKLKDITNAVLEELTVSCTDCGIASDIIDKQSFVCFPESPTHVTYRARLEGTSETDSGSLISRIEKWTSDGSRIIVTGVLMTVDSECLVAISSLSEGECQPPPTIPTPSSSMITTDSTASSSSSNTASIIAGVVVAVFSIVAIIVAIVVIVALILKHRRGGLSIKNAEE